MTNFVALGIVVGVAAKQTRFTTANLLAVLIVVVDGAKQSRFASTFISHNSYLAFYIFARDDYRLSNNKSNKTAQLGILTYVV